MSYEVRLSRAADKDFGDLPTAVQRQVLKCLERLAENPRPPKCKPLREQQLKGSYRVHVGPDHCIGYDIDDRAQVVEVWQIGKRDRFYDVAKRRRSRLGDGFEG